MSIESIKARLRRHDRQRMRYGYSDETAPQIWERELRALLKVAEAAKALEGYKQLYADTLDCLEDKCAELAALRAENERLRAFAQWVAAGEPSPAEYDPSADGRDEALSSGNSGDSELYGVLTVYYNMAQKAKAALQGGGSEGGSDADS